MSEPVIIQLHSDLAPGIGQVVGWVITANIFVVITTSVMFVLLPWLAGHQPKLDVNTVILAGLFGIALMVGFLFLAIRRHRRRGLSTPSAELQLDEHAEVRPSDGPPIRCVREELVIRPVHAHETLRDVDYYMGPALELTIREHTWVVAFLDGETRWRMDPPAVSKIDWICTSEAWRRLLAAEDLNELLVSTRVV